ncbi:hypothetical protein BV898_16987 [Hypsibius exemplaris]|uniref:LysM domain-containing protein n=1 Tax=Hypsibius exemplaris TaxID=2072580 RepID=A0A9X6RM06_HYPEX|nr:hypothetical protein BV898_16987 [Hypsibius exemplaris]
MAVAKSIILLLGVIITVAILTRSWYSAINVQRRYATADTKPDIYPMRFPRPGSPQKEAFVSLNPSRPGRAPAGQERGKGPCSCVATRHNDNCAELTAAYQLYNIRRFQEMNPHIDCDRIIPAGLPVLCRADAGCDSPCYREWC